MKLDIDQDYGIVKEGRFYPAYFNALFVLLRDAIAAGAVADTLPERITLRQGADEAEIELVPLLAEDEREELASLLFGDDRASLYLEIEALKATLDAAETSLFDAARDGDRDAVKKIAALVNSRRVHPVRGDWFLDVIEETARFDKMRGAVEMSFELQSGETVDPDELRTRVGSDPEAKKTEPARDADEHPESAPSP